jgi:hypothetical protein
MPETAIVDKPAEAEDDGHGHGHHHHQVSSTKHPRSDWAGGVFVDASMRGEASDTAGNESRIGSSGEPGRLSQGQLPRLTYQ